MPNIRHAVVIGASGQTVYDAIATQQGLASWWTPEVEAEPRVDSLARFKFGPDYTKEMRVVELSPRRVKWECLKGVEEWVGTTISFELDAGDEAAVLSRHPEAEDQIDQLGGQGEQTILTLGHDDWREYTPMFAECSYTWALFLRGLKALCQTGEGRPWPHQHQAFR